MVDVRIVKGRRFAEKALASGLRRSTSSINFVLGSFALENALGEHLPATLTAVARLLRSEGEAELAESFRM